MNFGLTCAKSRVCALRVELGPYPRFKSLASDLSSSEERFPGIAHSFPSTSRSLEIGSTDSEMTGHLEPETRPPGGSAEYGALTLPSMIQLSSSGVF